LPDDAGERRVDLKAFVQAGIRSTDGGVNPARCPYPLVRLCSFGLVFVSLEGAVNAFSARGLGCPVLAVPRTTNPQRVDRLTTSMLYP
jgi:hypothetical protein